MPAQAGKLQLFMSRWGADYPTQLTSSITISTMLREKQFGTNECDLDKFLTQLPPLGDSAKRLELYKQATT